METHDYLRVIRRWWILLLALPVVGASLAYGLSQLQTPVFESTAKVFVSAQLANSASDLNQGSSFTQQVVKNYAAVATTPIVLDPVISDLGLDLSADALASKMSVTSLLDTAMLEISVRDVSAADAATIANGVSTSLAAVVPQLTPQTAPDVPAVRLTQVQTATASDEPVSPRTTLNGLLGFIAGLAIAGLVVLLAERLDVRVRGRRDVEAVTDAPVLGAISFYPEAKKRPLIVHDAPHSARAEAFRALRTNLQFLDISRGARAIVVTSSAEGEGKTTTSANLAISIADAGSKVVLVDADLRRPRVAQYLGLEGTIGLTDVLIGTVSVDDALQSWGAQGLMVLPAGHVPPNPSELLQSKAMVELIAALKKRFGTVILDAPPLLPVTDAAILGARTSGVIVMAAAKRIKRPQLRAALDILDQVGARTLGVVVTMLPTKGADAHRTYGYAPLPSAAAPTGTTPRRA